MCKILWILFASVLVVGATTFVYADEFKKLARDLKSGNEAAKLKAVEALGESRDMRALKPLLDALKDDSALVQRHATAALRNLARVLSDAYRIMEWWFRDLLDKLGILLEDDLLTTEKRALNLV